MAMIAITTSSSINVKPRRNARPNSISSGLIDGVIHEHPAIDANGRGQRLSDCGVL